MVIKFKVAAFFILPSIILMLLYHGCFLYVYFTVFNLHYIIIYFILFCFFVLPQVRRDISLRDGSWPPTVWGTVSRHPQVFGGLFRVLPPRYTRCSPKKVAQFSATFMEQVVELYSVCVFSIFILTYFVLFNIMLHYLVISHFFYVFCRFFLFRSCSKILILPK